MRTRAFLPEALPSSVRTARGFVLSGARIYKSRATAAEPRASTAWLELGEHGHHGDCGFGLLPQRRAVNEPNHPLRKLDSVLLGDGILPRARHRDREREAVREDCLCARALTEPFDAVDAANARDLDAAERKRLTDVRDAVVVDDAHARDEGLCDPLPARGVAREHRRAEPVGAVVRKLDDLVVGGPLHDHHHRAKVLLAHDPHRVVHVDEHGRLPEEPFAGLAAPTNKSPRPRRKRVVDKPLNDVELARHRHGADVVAHLLGRPLRHRLDARHDRAHKRVVDRLVDIEALRTDAHLAARRENSEHGLRHGVVKVRVFANDHGVLAAELENHGSEGLGGLGHDSAPVLRRPGEENFVDARRDERRADVAPPYHKLHKIRREALRDERVFENGPIVVARVRRPLGDFDHRRVACVEDGEHRAHDVVERPVERRKNADDAQRLIEHSAHFVEDRAGRALLGTQPCFAFVEQKLDLLEDGEQLTVVRVHERFARVFHRELANLCLMIKDEPPNAIEDRVALGKRRLGPLLLRCAPARNRRDHLIAGRSPHRALAERCHGRRIEHRDHRRVSG
eukprot:Amastigsp_a339951_77.p1 type:complete len:569 gc:universal Amastigsp_a339951_77:1749-43(-)